jgi:rfaE bifunctional protein kinase chain/domain
MKKILVIGDAIVDQYLFGTIHRTSPEDATVPIVDLDSEDVRLGGCLNVAANIKSLSLNEGWNVDVSSIISHHTDELLRNRGINATFISQQANNNVIEDDVELIKVRVIAGGKQVLRIDNRSSYFKENIDIHHSSFSSLNLKEYDCIVVSDYNKGVIDDFIIEKLEKVDRFVFIDTKKKDLSKFSKIENAILKINLEEYTKASGIDTIKQLITTQGKMGSTLMTYGKMLEHFSTKAVVNADVTGAGDVFLAALVVEYLKSENLYRAIEFANKAARVSVKKQGTCEVDADEL